MNPTRQPPRLRATLSLIAAAALLAACGGGGDAPAPEAATAASAEPGLTAAGETPAEGRAQALAFVLPPLAPAPAGLAGNVECRNWRIGAITIDNLVVPPGRACRLNGTVVRGSVQVEAGAILIGAGTRVAGSVQGTDAAHVQVTGTTSSIGGNFEAEGGGSATLTGAAVAGDVFINGLLDVISVRNNRVAGNVQVTDNLGGGEISGNRITGNLQCSGNLPAPLAAGNTAALIEDQCLPGGGGGGGVPPLSGNVTCVGLTIGAIRLDSVIVPAGASCTLQGTLLNGGIEVGAASRLIAESVVVTGGLTSDGGAELRIGGSSSFGGSLQVQRGAAATITGATVTGDLQVDAMSGPVAASGNRVSGNAQVMANRGGVSLLNNRFGGVMQCKDNLPPPTGSGNVATLKEDQCRSL